MKINFILDGIGLSGGVRMVFNCANFLAKRGHDVALYVLKDPRQPPFIEKKSSFKQTLRDLKHFVFVQKFSLNSIPFPYKFPIHFVDSLNEKNVGDADIVIATACSTSFEVARYPKNKGEKFYFVQDFEDWSNPPKKVMASLKLPLKKIVTCRHLEKLVFEKSSQKCFARVLYGLEKKYFLCDKKVFYPQKNSLKILMIYNSAERKGGDDGIAALRIVKKQFPDVDISLFGIDRKIKKFKSWAKVYYFPSQRTLINLYRQADIFVFPSRREGFGLPGLEALAGGCALVATDVGAVREYSQHNKSSLISPPKNPQALAENIIYLLANPEKIKKLAEAGFKKALEFKMGKMGELFEKTLMGV